LAGKLSKGTMIGKEVEITTQVRTDATQILKNVKAQKPTIEDHISQDLKAQVENNQDRDSKSIDQSMLKFDMIITQTKKWSHQK
jgi:hypothetical protein